MAELTYDMNSPPCDTFTPHNFLKECKNCDQPKEDHDFDPEKIARVRQSFNLDMPMPPTGLDYTWVPKHCPLNRLGEFFGSLPNNKIPIIGSLGAKFRERQWDLQIPDADLSVDCCRFIDEDQVPYFQEYISDRNTNNVGEAEVSVLNENLPAECAKCQQVIENEQLVVISNTKDLAWHPACFRCSQCGEMPVDLIHCTDDMNRVFCIRDFDELYKPRCMACNELILAWKYTNAMDKDWHNEHFCCHLCNTNLTKITYYSDNNLLYCLKCFEKQFRSICKKCNKEISASGRRINCRSFCWLGNSPPLVELPEDHWHEECFLCLDCSSTLENGNFFNIMGNLYCAKCYYARHELACEKCGETFVEPKSLKVEYKERIYHPQCFRCTSCSKPLSSCKFTHRDNQPYCISCFKEKFASKCTVCSKCVIKNGVNFKGKKFHRDCFVCENCGLPLTKRILLKEDMPYCKNCYVTLFCKRCNFCDENIIGNVEFFAFEDHAWHKNCFRCMYCKTSLAGEKFLHAADGVMCTKCWEL